MSITKDLAQSLSALLADNPSEQAKWQARRVLARMDVKPRLYLGEEIITDVWVCHPEGHRWASHSSLRPGWIFIPRSSPFPEGVKLSDLTSIDVCFEQDWA